MVASSQPSIPPGSVIVTPEDMWTAIGEIRDTGHRTENAINELRLTVNPVVSELRQDVDKHDKRITALEEQSWASRWVPAIVMSLIVTVIGGVAIYVITHI